MVNHRMTKMHPPLKKKKLITVNVNLATHSCHASHIYFISCHRLLDKMKCVSSRLMRQFSWETEIMEKKKEEIWRYRIVLWKYVIQICGSLVFWDSPSAHYFVPFPHCVWFLLKYWVLGQSIGVHVLYKSNQYKKHFLYRRNSKWCFLRTQLKRSSSKYFNKTHCNPLKSSLVHWSKFSMAKHVASRPHNTH